MLRMVLHLICVLSQIGHWRYDDKSLMTDLVLDIDIKIFSKLFVIYLNKSYLCKGLI